jgi:D-galactarolactone cycloisomerase
MKITKVEAIHIGIPYEHGVPKPLMSTGQPRTTMESVYIRVDTDQGLTGWGEAFGFAACRATTEIVRGILAPLAVGRDPLDRAGVMADFSRRFQSMGRNGPASFALAGFDIALWDIAGKAKGVPVHALLAPTTKTRIPAYASLLRTLNPGHVATLVERAAAEGYVEMKIHERTEACVARARDVAGPHTALMLDVNCAWTLEEALDLVLRLERYDLGWVEEPTYPADDFEAMARLRRHSHIPIAAGENIGSLAEVRHALRDEALDILQPDVIKLGLTDTWACMHLGHDAGIRVDAHCPYYGPGLIASLHLIAAAKEEIACEFFHVRLEASPLGEMIYPHKGHYPVPTGKGLGFEVDEKLLATYRIG